MVAPGETGQAHLGHIDWGSHPVRRVMHFRRHRRRRVELRRLLTEAVADRGTVTVLAEHTLTIRVVRACDAVLSQLSARTFTLMVW